jgi:hypothetical protein
MNNNQNLGISKELNHHYRTINMLLTIYEKLHNRYRLRARILDTFLLLAAIFLSLTTFVDQKILQILQITPEIGQMILWISSFMIFAIAVFSLLIDWEKKTATFGQAIDTLVKIQIDCHEQLKVAVPEEPWDLKAKCLVYSSIINNLPKIPEHDYHQLKAFHKRQMELGKMIDLYPGGSVLLLRVFTFFRANSHVLLRKPFGCNNDEIDKND